ncbi:MAG: RluA family pseudouridine synthase [Verrucomicrobia bacterium]|nr:RluA family pseudouridine synthase [Verrucomicrobiota bacterium]
MRADGNRVSSFIVERSLPNERLDTLLRIHFPAASRGTLKRLIEQGNVRVDGQPVKPAHHPRQGERIDVHWPEPKAAGAQPEEIPLDILYEDEDLIVLNKPPGLVVHPSAGHDEHTLVNALLHHCRGQLSGIGGVARPGIVHRLDRDTSGCLVVAKNDLTHLSLAKQFHDRVVEKVYHALVCGEVRESSGEIRAAIARHPSHRKRMAVTEGQGREAWTSYRVLEKFRHGTWLEATLHTGRTHQIRVHFHHLGAPLIGDETYGRRQNNRLKELAGYAAPRQMLHARTLSFTHPGTAEALTFEAPLPRDFLDALAMLRRG